MNKGESGIQKREVNGQKALKMLRMFCNTFNKHTESIPQGELLD
jgi:hypothetical protein